MSDTAVATTEEKTMKVENEHCTVLLDTALMSREEWLDARRQGIGGSDAGAVMGLSPWKSAFMVYLEKQGLAPETEITDPIRHGIRMEPVLRREFPDLYRQEEDVEVEVYKSPYLYQSTQYPWMLANIDGLVMHPVYGLCGLEVKTTDTFNRKEWADNEVPDHYYAQVQHYCAVLGLPGFFVPVLIGRHFTYRWVPRNYDFITDLIEAESNFWSKNIIVKSTPETQGIENEDAYISELYGKTTDETTVEAPELEDEAEEYLELNKQVNELEKRKKQIQQKVKMVLGEAMVGVFGARKATWSRFERLSFDKDRFGKDFPDLLKTYTEKKPTSRLLIK